MVYFTSYGYNDKPNGFYFTVENAQQKHTSSNKSVAYCRVPEDWEMFTRKGNRRVADIMQVFTVQLINKLKAEEALERALKKFVKLYKSKTMAEASDTAVREAVYGYVQKFSCLFDFGRDSVDKIWERIV